VKQPLELTVNGERHRIGVDPQRTLLEVLHDDLHLTGTKYGCGEGECGACTVIVDGRSIMSCLILALAVDGRSVLTIEGLSEGRVLSRLQTSFLEKGAAQCGYCTPGVIMSAKALLDENPNPTGEEVRESMEGNLCRCTGYAKIVEAVLAASRNTGDKSQ
jgi:carbon-monoxide dehydrogenase small subunit